MTWAPERHRKRGRPRTTWRRTAEKEGERERSGATCPLQRPTERVGDRVSRPCAPLSVKKLGEDDDYPLH